MLILLVGNDVWKVEQDLLRLREHFSVKHDPTGLNTSDFSLLSQAEEFFSTIGASPFMAEKRFVVGRDILDGFSKLNETLQERWRDLPEHAIVVLVEKKPSSELSEIITQLEISCGATIQKRLYDLSEKINVEEVDSVAKHYGLHLNQIQNQALAASCEGDIAYVHTACQALAAAIATKDSPIPQDLFAKFVPAITAENVFTFIDCLLGQQTARAQDLLAKLIAGGDEPALIWTLIYGEIRKLAALAHSPNDLAAVTRDMAISPYQQKKFTDLIRTLSPKIIDSLVKTVWDGENKVKTGQFTYLQALESLIDVFLVGA